MNNFFSKSLKETAEEFKKSRPSDKVLVILVIAVALSYLFYHGFIHTGLIHLPPAKAVDCAPYSNPTAHTVEIKDDSFVPNKVNAKVCDKIRFINTEDVLHEPATGPHPTHTSYPGFDALKPLQNGEEYIFTLERPGTYTFHDHLTPRMVGEISITK